MPAEQRGSARKLPSGKWQLRWYDREGKRCSGGAFSTKTEALRHYRDVIEPALDGRSATRRDITLQELADTFLERHAKIAQPRTIRAVRERLKRPLEAHGNTRLAELEGMTDELAAFAAKLPEATATQSCPHCGRRARRESARGT
jgi:hypothetical protein